MTSRKRKAEAQLTSSSVAVIVPIQAPSAMFDDLSAHLATAWNWCIGLCKGIFQAPPTYSTMTYESAEVVSEDHIQSAKPRAGGDSTLKRRRTRRTKQQGIRSKSAVDIHRKAGGRGTLDFTGIEDESVRRRIVDDFWSPPDLDDFFKKSGAGQSPLLAQTPQKVEEDDGIRGTLYRRHSDPSELTSPPASSESIPGQKPNFRDSAFGTSSARRPRTPESLPGRIYPPFQPKGNPGKSIEEYLEGLLLGPTHLRTSFRGNSIRAEKERENRRREQENARRRARERRLIRLYPPKPLVQPLDPEWERNVRTVETSNDQHRVMTRSQEGTELRLKDFRTVLGHRAWLNDEIINSYIEWVVRAANDDADVTEKLLGEPPSTVPKFIAHNSFFYENLRKKGPQSTDRLMKRKKAPGDKLLEVDSVFVPICQGSHWTIGVVRPVAKTIEYFDSMGGRPQAFISQMRAWLQHQLGELYRPEEWSEPRTACARQSNGYDCGVFVCTNAFCVAMGLDTSCYEERDMEMQRRVIAAVLLNKGFEGRFAWNQWGLLPY